MILAEDSVLLRAGLARLLTDEGLRAAVEIRTRWPAVGVLVLSQYVERRYAVGIDPSREHHVDGHAKSGDLTGECLEVRR